MKDAALPEVSVLLEIKMEILELFKLYHIHPESFENYFKSQWTLVHPYAFESFKRFSSETVGTCRLLHCF